MPSDEFEEVIPNAADEGQVLEATRQSRKRKDQAADFWKACLATPIGRQEIWGLLQSCSTFEDRFACGPNGFPQPERTWFLAGEQAFGLRFYQSLLRMDRLGVLAMHDQCDPNFAKPKRRKIED